MSVASPPHTASESRKWLVLVAVGLCVFLGSLDGSIVNVALPTLIEEFNTDFSTIQWVTLAYLIGLALLLVSMGRLADIIGKKRVFVTGIVLFLAGSALCGLAPDVYWLIGFRFLQSIGAAMMLGLGMAILTETWPSSERGMAIGLSAGFISLGIVAGPLIGGAILAFTTWHWIFYVNVPIGLVALAISILYLPALKPTGSREPFDFAGGAALGVALLAFAIAMSFGQELGFAAPLVLGLLLIAIAASVVFVTIEQRIQYPMVDLSLFREPQFSLNLFTAALIFVALSGVVLLLPFYLTYVMKLPLGQVGLMMAVVPLVMIVVQPLSGALSDIWGSRQVSVLGLVLILFGYLLMSTLRVDGTELGFIVRMLPVSTGMAIFNSPNNSAIMGAAPRNRLGIASALLSMVRTVAQVFGIAALGAFFAGRVDLYSGAAVNLDVAPPQAIVQALHDQFILVSLLVMIGLAVSLLTWRWEVKAGRAQKRVEVVAGAAPVETLPFEG